MVECGCTIEDVAMSVRAPIADVIYAVAPALKHNKREAARIRQMLWQRNLPPISTEGTGARVGKSVVYLPPAKTRNAA
jgi:hypothetical protein